MKSTFNYMKLLLLLTYIFFLNCHNSSSQKSNEPNPYIVSMFFLRSPIYRDLLNSSIKQIESLTANKTCMRDDSCKIFTVRDASTCFGYEFIGSKEYTNESLFIQKSEAHYQLSIEYVRNSGLALICPAIVVFPTPVLCEDTNCTGIGNLIKNISFSERKCSTDSSCKSIALTNKKCSSGKSFFIYSNETVSDLEMAKQSQYYERLVANPNNSEFSLERYFFGCEFESEPNLSCINSVCRKNE